MSSPPPQPAWTAAAVARFADDVGAAVGEDAYGPLLETGAAALPAEGPFVAPLADLGLLSVADDEAARFLHAQLTNDVEHLAPGAARWAGYCTAKGRLLATFRYWRDVAVKADRP